jgi:hypothetical protein
VSRRPSPAARPRSPELARLALIRVTLLAGVLVFGGAVYFLRKTSPPPLLGPADELRIAGVVIGVLAAAGILVFRSLARNAPDANRRASYSIVGWAIGEAAALYGGVYYFLTGRLGGYMVGLMILLASFVFIPVVQRRR